MAAVPSLSKRTITTFHDSPGTGSSQFPIMAQTGLARGKMPIYGARAKKRAAPMVRPKSREETPKEGCSTEMLQRKR
jgi:hypothetical protein